MKNLGKLLLPAILLVELTSACATYNNKIDGLNGQSVYPNKIEGLNGQSTKLENVEKDSYRTIEGLDNQRLY